MKSSLIIVGSGRLAFQVADLILESELCKGYEAFSYCRHAPPSSPTPFQRLDSLPRHFDYLIAVGNPSQRRDEAHRIIGAGISATAINIISSNCYIAENTIIAKNSGVVILPRAIISTKVSIGQFALIGSGAIIEHDSSIGEYCTIGPGAVICGEVEVGNLSFVGANSTIVQKLSIGCSCIIGAGAVVTKKVEDGHLGIGNPCRVKRKEAEDCNPL